MTAARTYFDRAFCELEGSISHAKSQSHVLQILAEVHADELAKPYGTDGSIVPEAVFFMVTEVANSLNALSAQHLALHNTSPDVWKPGMAAAPVDPLLDLVERYRHECARYNAIDNGESDPRDDALYALLVAPLYAQLRDETPAATTEAGAVAAIKLAAEEMGQSHGGFDRPLVCAALAYFEGRAA